MNSNPALGLIGFWMLLQLAATLAILIGGIYALFCLGRASAGLDRMATAMEEWVAQQKAAGTQATSTPTAPGTGTALTQRLAASASPETSPTVVQAQPFSPAAPAFPSTSPTEYSRPDEYNS
jgi:hypothetical protein